MKTAGPVFHYRLPQDVSLGKEFDSLGAGGCHGLYVSSCLSFGPKIIPKAIFNDQGKDEYEMGKRPLDGSGKMAMTISVCLMECLEIIMNRCAHYKRTPQHHL